MLTKKQKLVLEYIQNYIRSEGISPTQREIKDHFELKSFGSVQRYLKYLKDAGFLTFNWNSKRGIELTENEKENSNTLEIPILGKIAAGLPIEAIDSGEETISIPVEISRNKKNLFGLLVRGDSMIERGILDGDMAIIEHGKSVSSGDIVAAVIDDEATLKIFKKETDSVMLLPANKNYRPIKVVNNLRVAGKLIGIIRTY